MVGSALFHGPIIKNERKYSDEFKTSSVSEALGQFHQNLAKIILERREFKFSKWRAPAFPKGRKLRNSEIDDFKNFSSQNPLGQF